jgi:ribosomal protein S18 acetylase RimI-like enzyme
MITDLPLPLDIRQHLRPLDARRDLVAVADLVELCFNDTLDPEGRNYLKQMRQAAQHAALIGWANSLYPDGSMPPVGLVWVDGDPQAGEARLVGNLSLIPINLQGKRGTLIANVAVHPDFRGRGIGRALTVAGLEMARKRGVPAAWLQVRDDNPSAIHIYKTCGFLERARRSSWVTTADIPSGSPAYGANITSRQPDHWPQQKAWLSTLYPKELSWHLPLDWKALDPDLPGSFYRLFTWYFPRHWAVLQDNRLAGMLTYAQSSGQTDYLWLAAPPEANQQALFELLRAARRSLPRRRPLSLNLPASMAAQALRSAGFSTHQTLIWMEYRFGNASKL